MFLKMKIRLIAIVEMTIDIKDQANSVYSSILHIVKIAMCTVTACIANSLNISNLLRNLDSWTFCLAMNIDAKKLSIATITN